MMDNKTRKRTLASELSRKQDQTLVDQLVEITSKNSSIFKASQYSKQKNTHGNAADPRGQARRLDHLNVLCALMQH